MSERREMEKVVKGSPAKVAERQRVAKPARAAMPKAFKVTRDGWLVVSEGLPSVKLVKIGLPFDVVRKFARHVDVPDTNVLAKIGVTGGTVDRRRKAEVLKPDESDRFYRLARVAEMAERVLEDPAKARDWLKTKNRALGGVTPFSLLDTEPGVEMVQDALNRIDYGVYG